MPLNQFVRKYANGRRHAKTRRLLSKYA